MAVSFFTQILYQKYFDISKNKPRKSNIQLLWLEVEKLKRVMSTLEQAMKAQRERAEV
jgi:hypothetical protein